MKFLFALLLTGASVLAQNPGQTKTFTTTDSPRVTSSGYVDWALISKQPIKLISLFGYNGGSAAYVQLYDTTNGPINTIADSVQAANTWTFNLPLYQGQAIQFTNTIGTLAAGIYYARLTTNSATIVQLYDTKLHALTTSATTGIKTVSGDGLSGNPNHVPTHSFAVAATDNYSCIVQNTGINFGRGLCVALSSTGPTYTATTTNLTICATYLPPD